MRVYVLRVLVLYARERLDTCSAIGYVVNVHGTRVHVCPSVCLSARVRVRVRASLSLSVSVGARVCVRICVGVCTLRGNYHRIHEIFSLSLRDINRSGE